MRSIELIALIYQSVQYLNFLARQLKGPWNQVPGWDVRVRVVANDPTPQVEQALEHCGIPFDVYRDPHPQDYYLNRVYRCFNFAGSSSTADHICFLNSDMALSPGWLERLLAHHDGTTIPCSRLVESGKMPSGLHGISNNFGRHPNGFDEAGWLAYAAGAARPEVHADGLFMPCVFSRDRFVESGMYPEGNIYEDGVGTRGQFVKSGDAYYFEDVLGARFGMRHVTVFDSLVYHIQEGEMDEPPPAGQRDGFLLEPDWSRKYWAEAVLAYFRAFKAGEPVLLILAWPPETNGGVPVQLVQESLGRIAASAGLEDFPDVVLLTDPEETLQTLEYCASIQRIPPPEQGTDSLLGPMGRRLAQTLYRAGPTETLEHTEFLVQLVKLCRFRSYLELGIYQGETLHAIAPLVEHHVGVDVVNKLKFKGLNFFLGSTADFFAQNTHTFDCIFIDADHRYQAVALDLELALGCLNRGGVILLHDTNPVSRHLLDDGYCSNACKIVEDLAQRPELNFVSLPMLDPGITLITRAGEERCRRFL